MAFALIVYGAGVVQASAAPLPNAVAVYDNAGGLNPAALNVAGPGAANTLALAQAAYTTNASIPANVTYARADATAGAMLLVLPPSASVIGQTRTIKKIDASGNLVTVQGNGSENIDGANTDTSLSAQYDALRLFANGTGWDIV